jgi:hypothetical protein
VSNLNNALNTLLTGMSAENAELVMAEINAMDKMDIASWNNLSEVLDGMDIDYSAEALERLSVAGIAAYNAIEKINFDTLAQDINNIYETINKARAGNRTYTEEEYKEFIAANKSLEKTFVQIGKDFIYVGGTIETLIAALEENTITQMDEANRQLNARAGMAGIISKEAENHGEVGAMSNFDLMEYLTAMREKVSAGGYDLADFGIAGLSNTTNFSKATTEQLKEWAGAIALEGGKEAVYRLDYAKGVDEANIARFSQNNAHFNA